MRFIAKTFTGAFVHGYMLGILTGVWLMLTVAGGLWLR